MIVATWCSESEGKPESKQVITNLTSPYVDNATFHASERVFSLMNKNKTSSRSPLSLDGMLLLIKTCIEEPLKWKLSEELI